MQYIRASKNAQKSQCFTVANGGNPIKSTVATVATVAIIGDCHRKSAKKPMFYGGNSATVAKTHFHRKNIGWHGGIPKGMDSERATVDGTHSLPLQGSRS